MIPASASCGEISQKLQRYGVQPENRPHAVLMQPDKAILQPDR